MQTSTEEDRKKKAELKAKKKEKNERKERTLRKVQRVFEVTFSDGSTLNDADWETFAVLGSSLNAFSTDQMEPEDFDNVLREQFGVE